MPTAVDPEAAQETIDIFQKTLQDFSWQTAAVLVCLLVAAIVAIRVIVSLADKAMTQAKLDRGVRTFLRSGLKVVLWLVAICALLGYLGVPMTSLVALLSVLGLAVSLAIQGTLVYTKLNTIDNKVVYIPNGEISAKTITNYSGNDKRRVELLFSAAYDAPVEKVKECMVRVVGEHPLTLPTPEPLIRVNRYGSSAIEYILRVWCGTDDYWTVYFDLLEQVKAAFDKAGIEMTYDHLNVHMVDGRGE